jgi:hypothetical protein
MAKENLTPKTANTFNKVFKLERDNVSTRNSWISVSPNRISIYNQKNGQSSTGNVSLTKKEFERFIKFYETGK